MGLDRDAAREAVEAYDAKFDTVDASSLHPGHPGEWMDELLEALEACVAPRLAEVDVRLVSEAEAKLARVRALVREYGADPIWPEELHKILDARP